MKPLNRFFNVVWHVLGPLVRILHPLEVSGVEKEGDVEIKGGVAVIGIRTGAIFVPVFVDGKKRPFHKTRLIFGEPYRPTYTGRHGTAEEVQQIANEVMRRAYALGEEHPL